MPKDNIKLVQPGKVDDQLTEILRNGAHALLAQAVATDPDCIEFSPSVLPPTCAARNGSRKLLPVLYLKGISTGDFSEALAARLGQGCCRVVGIRHRPSEGRPA